MPQLQILVCETQYKPSVPSCYQYIHKPSVTYGFIPVGVSISHMVTLTADLPSRQSVLKGTRTDRILLLASLLCIVISYFVIQSNISAGPAVAEIYHGNMLMATYPLPQKGQEPIHYELEGKLGLSEVIIDEQGARISSSPCSSQRCVLSGSHKHAGDVIACVPNRILITLRGSSESRFDAIVE